MFEAVNSSGVGSVIDLLRALPRTYVVPAAPRSA
jgi:hypothetical protein